MPAQKSSHSAFFAADIFSVMAVQNPKKPPKPLFAPKNKAIEFTKQIESFYLLPADTLAAP